MSKVFDGKMAMRRESRKAYRRAVSLTAMILNGDKSMVGLCTMLNMSSTGAMIKPPLETEVPNEFILLLSKDGNVRRRCKILWRTDTAIGVQFIA
jgi:hypothetical protein